MAAKAVSYRLVVLGDGGVGKTALTIWFIMQHFVETYDPTIEDSYCKDAVIDGLACTLDILDTGGAYTGGVEETSPLPGEWIRGVDGFVLMYSVSSRSSFDHVGAFHRQIVGERPNPRRLVVLVGNKTDRVTEREVPKQEGYALARELGCEFVETSAKNGENVEKAFYDVARMLRRQQRAAGGNMRSCWCVIL